MKRIHMHIAEEDLAILDGQAHSEGISRSEFLRTRVLNSVNGKKYSPRQYQELISAAQRRSNVPRSQVEQLVNFLFIKLMEPRVEEANRC